MWGGSSELIITQVRYVNDYIYVSGRVHLDASYNAGSWCAKGPVGKGFNAKVAAGWVSGSVGNGGENQLRAPDGSTIRAYISGCWQAGGCVPGNNDYIWIGQKVYNERGTWETVRCNNATSGGLIGVERDVLFGLMLIPETRLTGGQVYTLSLKMNGGEVKSTVESELDSVLQGSSFISDVLDKGGMSYSTVSAKVSIPVEVMCTATVKNDVDWGRLAFTTAYFDRYEKTGINVDCNGSASVTVTQKTADGINVGFGLTSMLTGGTTRPGTWPLRRTVNKGITTIPLFSHLYGTMSGAGKFSGVHILNVVFD